MSDINRHLSSRRLCIQIPRAGGLLIERGDEELLKLDLGDGMYFRTQNPRRPTNVKYAT
jgi:hypothetical protein